MGQRARGSNPAGGVTMILVERYLLPPGRTEEERLAIVRERVRKRRGVSGRVIAVFPGEDDWVRQLAPHKRVRRRNHCDTLAFT